MLKCEIAKVVFGFEMVSEAFFQRMLRKYQVDKEPQVKVYSKVVSVFAVPLMMPIYTSNFYDLYCIGDSIWQIQKNPQTEEGIAKMIYSEKEVYIEILDQNIELTEYLMTQYLACYYIMKNHKAIMMHSSCIMYQGKAYLFSAKSGTGKSTHTKLWKKYEDAVHINDDKNIILYENGQLMVYGNPWSGKHQLDNNITAPLKSIIYLFQDNENRVKRLSKREALLKLLTQVVSPNPLYDKDQWDEMTNLLVEVPSFYYGCNISKEAVDVIKKELERIEDEI